MNADEYRSRPGFVYSVGSSLKMTDGMIEQEPYEPACSCPCHLADAPYPHSWYCNRCHRGIVGWTTANVERVPYTHKQAIADGKANPRQPTQCVVDYYFITKGNNPGDAFPHRHLMTEKAAQRAADELNTKDVLASLNLTPTALARRERLKSLGYSFWMAYGEGHPETRLPRDPGRYAVQEYSERYSQSFWDTHATLDDVRDAIKNGDVMEVVDLDTGEKVPFTVTVNVGIGRDPV